MQTIFTAAIAAVAVVNALPSEHRRGHSHARRDVDYSKIDWNAIDWASVFGNKASAQVATPAAAAPATAQTAQAVVQAGSVATQAAAAAQTTASSVVPASGATGSKKGLAWDQANDPSLHTLFSSLSWGYNWGLSSSFSSSMDFYPMVKSRGDLAGVSSLARGSKLLGYNEPEQNGISPSDAAADYKSTLTPLIKSGALSMLSSPAITNGGDGLPWLQSFMAQCADCGITDLAVHFYGPNFAMFQSQMEAIHAAFPTYNILITEIGCTNWNAATNPSASEVAAFNAQAIAWLEQTSWVSKYAFFGAMPITDANLGTVVELLNGRVPGSTLTSLGQQYVA